MYFTSSQGYYITKISGTTG